MIWFKYFLLAYAFIYFSLSDTVPPVISFTNAPSVTNKYPRFTWTSTEQATFECSFDGERYGNCSSGVEGVWSKDNVRDGRHVLSVRGKDLAQNLGRPAQHTWIVGKILKTNDVCISLPY